RISVHLRHPRSESALAYSGRTRKHKTHERAVCSCILRHPLLPALSHLVVRTSNAHVLLDFRDALRNKSRWALHVRQAQHASFRIVPTSSLVVVTNLLDHISVIFNKRIRSLRHRRLSTFCRKKVVEVEMVLCSEPQTLPDCREQACVGRVHVPCAVENVVPVAVHKNEPVFQILELELVAATSNVGLQTLFGELLARVFNLRDASCLLGCLHSFDCCSLQEVSLPAHHLVTEFNELWATALFLELHRVSQRLAEVVRVVPRKLMGEHSSNRKQRRLSGTGLRVCILRESTLERVGYFDVVPFSFPGDHLLEHASRDSLLANIEGLDLRICELLQAEASHHLVNVYGLA